MTKVVHKAHSSRSKAGFHRFRGKGKKSKSLQTHPMLQMQKTVGNHAIGQMIRAQIVDVNTIQRLPVRPGAPRQPRPSQPQPQSSLTLATTPASAMRPIPARVRAAHQARVNANDLNGALQVMVNFMERRGDIDRSILAPATATRGAAICATTREFSVNNTMGRNASMTPCGCSGSLQNRRLNARIEIGPAAIRRAETLQSTLFHEFRHVRQDYARCNAVGATTTGSGLCTDCNNPQEMDAYLAEIEGGYDPPSLLHAWVRVYVNWPYLAPNQQRIFQPRRNAARRKINRHFSGLNWNSFSQVIAYRNHCAQLDARLGVNTRGICDDPLAPLNLTQPLPGPGQKGDFPPPRAGERAT